MANGGYDVHEAQLTKAQINSISRVRSTDFK